MGYDFGSRGADIVVADRVYTQTQSLILAKKKMELEKETFRLIFRDDPDFDERFSNRSKRLSDYTDKVLADAGINNFAMFPSMGQVGSQ